MRDESIILVNYLQTASLFEVRKQFDKVLKRNAHVYLLYVMPKVPVAYFQIPSLLTLYENAYTEAKQQLAEVGACLNIPNDHQWLITGSIAQALAEVRKQLPQSNIEFNAYPPSHFDAVQPQLV